MNKTELIAVVAEKSGVSRKDTEQVINVLLDTLTDTMIRKGKVQLSGFGTFAAKYRRERVGRNPRTKEPTAIAAGWIPAFTPSKSLKEQVDSNETG